MSASEATLAAALQQLMRDWDIYDALTLQAVLENDAGFARALAPALWLLLQEAGPSRSSTGTMTDGDAVVEAYVPDLFGRQCGGYINCRGDGC